MFKTYWTLFFKQSILVRPVYDLLIRVVGGVAKEQVREILAGLYKVVGMRDNCSILRFSGSLGNFIEQK